MRETLELKAEPRDKVGKGPSYRTRKSGRIPGIVYGGETAPEAVQVDERTLGRMHSTGSLLQTLVMLELSGQKTRVIPRAVQLDPVTDRPVHVDFLRLTPGGRISLEIPVHFRGQENSPGLKRGGVLNVVRHEVALLCPVENIPEFIEGDLSGLDIGDSLHISAFTLPEGVRPMIRERDFTVATIAPPTTYTEETPTAAAAVEGARLPRSRRGRGRGRGSCRGRCRSGRRSRKGQSSGEEVTRSAAAGIPAAGNRN
jgi:large subunit ribosomal protein L25